MGKALILLIFVVILLVAAIAGFYFLSKKAPQNQLELSKKFLLGAIDMRSKAMISIPFTMVSNNTIMLNGITRNDSFISIYIPQQIMLLEFYVQDPNYYTDMKAVAGGDSYTIEAMPVGNISLIYQGNLTQERGAINVSIQTDYVNREISFCLQWSRDVIDVTAPFPTVMRLENEADCEYQGFIWYDSQETCNLACKLGLKPKNVTRAYCSIEDLAILPPKRIMHVDRCYLSKKTITATDPLNFTLSYKSYPPKDDYILVHVIDSNKNLDGRYVFENETGGDVGQKDKKFYIR